jgi:hypothetical protein
MEKFEFLGDVLVSTDRGTKSSKIEITDIDTDLSKDMMTIQFFRNPACNTHTLGKPLAQSAQIIKRAPKRKNKSSAGQSEIPVKELLALAEVRYLEDVSKIQTAVKRNNIVQNIRVMMFLIKARPLVDLLVRMIQKHTFFKWKGLAHERSSKQIPCKSSKMISFFTLWIRIEKRKLMSAFVYFNERGMHVYMMKQCYVVEERYRNKMSLFVPPTPQIETNKDKLKKLGLDVSTGHKKNLQSTRKEFKRSQLMKYSHEDKHSKKAMGKSYFV